MCVCVCVYAPLLVTLLQTFYRVLTDNMAKKKLTNAENRKILEQIDADNTLKPKKDVHCELFAWKKKICKYMCTASTCALQVFVIKRTLILLSSISNNNIP